MARVIVIGGANVDIKGRSTGPYIPGTSNPGDVVLSVGGVGRNIAENLARLGLDVSLLTVIGEDSNGGLVREACAAAGVDLSLTLSRRDATGTYLVVLDHNGELISAINDMRAIESLSVADLEAAADSLSTADMIVCDCNISAECLEWLCSFSAASNVRLLIEPVSVPKARKLMTFERNSPVFAISPNRQQIEALTGERSEERALAKLHDTGFANIVLHRGGQGALVSDGRTTFEVSSLHADAIADVTGAGDAAVAGLVFGLLEGYTLVQAAKLGQAAASIKLSTRESVASSLVRETLMRRAGLT